MNMKLMTKFLYILICVFISLDASAQWTLIDREQVDRAVLEILPVRDSDPDYDTIINEQMVVGSIVAVTDTTALQADRQLRILVDKGPPPVWEDWPPGDGATDTTILNSITGSENWGFTYLIGNTTSSTITISNPFTDNRSILVSLRETAPPYRVHTTEIKTASSEKIILSATEIPSLNQFALSVIRAATSFLCGGAEVIEVTHGLGTDKVIAQAWENNGEYRVAWADTVITDATMRVTFPEAVAENAYRISLYPTFNYWSFPDTAHSEVEHSLNDRNLISMIVDEDGGSATLDILHEHNNSLIGNFEETPTADQYRVFSIPVHAPFSDFNGTINSASTMTIIDGEVIGAN